MSPVVKKQKQEKAIKKVESEEESVDESDEEVQVAPKKVMTKKVAPKKVAAKKAPVKKSEESDESEEEEVNTKRKSSKDGKKVAAKKVAPKKVAAKKAAKKSSAEESEEATSKVSSRKSSRKSSKKVDEEPKVEGHFELFVGGLSYNATKEDIEAYFNEIVKVLNVNLLMGDRGSKGLAFVRVGSQKEMDTCIAATGSEFMGRNINIEQAKKREAREPRPDAFRKPMNASSGVAGQSCSIFVGNLSYNTDEGSLSAAFENCGDVVSVRVAKNPEGRSRGFGHVDFATPEAAEKALSKNGEDVDGRAVRVDLSQGKQQRPAGGQGGFGGGYKGGNNKPYNNDRSGGYGGQKKRF